MTIPTPKAKYNLLNDGNRGAIGPPRFNFHAHKSAILTSLCIGLLSLTALSLIIVHLITYESSPAEPEQNYIKHRAELYSFDEFVNQYEIFTHPEDNSTKKDDNLTRTPLKLVCYYNAPANTADSLKPSDIDCKLCTHINIAFVSIQNYSILIDERMKDTINQVVALKKCNENLKVLLSVGGASSDSNFPEMVLTHATRKLFIQSIKSTLRSLKLDGIDLDWEFPGLGININEKVLQSKYSTDKRQRQHFSQLLREIRAEYIRENRNYLLTVAVAAPESIVNIAYDVGELNKYVDFINVMTYDFHFYTKYTPFTGINSPLYKRKEETLYFSTLNINYTAHLWLQKGMDRSKIVIGLPTYGHSFTLVNGNNFLPGSPASGYGKLGDLGFVNYGDICQFVNKNTNVHQEFDNDTLSPYLHHDYEWISYEDKQSMINKGKFVRHHNFGGAMVYSLNSDDYSGVCSQDQQTKLSLTRYLSDLLFDDDL